MEERVYVCRWKQSTAGFELWLRSKPQIRAQGQTYSDAEERLITAIQDSGGAMILVFQFDHPLPKSTLEAKYSNPELLLIGGDSYFQTDAPKWSFGETKTEIDDRLRWSDDFFETPVCRVCKRATSRRTTKPLSLTHVEGSYDGAFGSVGTEAGNVHQLVSEEFLKLLTVREKRKLEFQLTVRKGKKHFYELKGPDGPAPVAVRGLKHAGWRCKRCGFRTWGYWIKNLPIQTFIAQGDLPQRLPSIFTAGRMPDVELVATAARWQELVGHKGTRGFVSRRLGVVPDREVIIDPKLQLLMKKRS